PPLVRRQPVPPRVQVAPDAAGPALPRVRGRGARAFPGTRRRRLPGPRVASGPVEDGLPEVAELFVEMARVPSPSGEERAVADQVVRYLRGLALPVDEDHAGTEIGSTMGNLLCRIEPTAEGTPVFFCAHLDTVPPEGPLEPVVDDGFVRNGGGRSSAPTTRRRWRRCWRQRGGSSLRTGLTAGWS